MHRVYATAKRTYPIRVENDSGVVIGNGDMPDPNRIRKVVSAPAYRLVRPAAARPPSISPTRKTVRNRKRSEGRSSTKAKAREASTPLSRLMATRLSAERTLVAKSN